jgi:hypothetical protein
MTSRSRLRDLLEHEVTSRNGRLTHVRRLRGFLEQGLASRSRLRGSPEQGLAPRSRLRGFLEQGLGLGNSRYYGGRSVNAKA